MATHDCEKGNKRYKLIYQIKSKTVWNIQLAVKIQGMERPPQWGSTFHGNQSHFHEEEWTGGNISLTLQEAFAIQLWHLKGLPVYVDFQIYASKGQSHKCCCCYSYLLMCTELLYGIFTQDHSWNWNSSFSSMTQNIQNNNHCCHQLSPKHFQSE